MSECLSLAVNLIEKLRQYDSESVFADKYEQISFHLYGILCTLSQRWDGSEEHMLDSVLKFSNVVTRRFNVHSRFVILRYIESSLESIINIQFV